MSQAPKSETDLENLSTFRPQMTQHLPEGPPYCSEALAHRDIGLFPCGTY